MTAAKKKSRKNLLKEAAARAKEFLKTGKRPKEKKLTKKQQAEQDDYMLPWTIVDEIGDKVKSGEIKVDYRGHYKGYFEGWFKGSLSMMLMSLRNDKRAMEILKNRRDGKVDNRAVYLEHYSDLTCNSCCADVRFKLTKSKLTADSKCAHPDGYPAYSVRINVPSGKLIFANDFRDLVSINASYDINRTRGTEQTTRAYADAGMIHIYVGNSCPGLYKVSDRRINVVCAESRSGGEADDYADLPSKAPKGKHVGGICTDLWWYSAMDYDHFKKLAKKAYGKDWKKATDYCDIVKVEPGCYKATAQAHLVRNDGNRTEDGGYYSPEEMFSFIKRDGDCRKLKPQSGYASAAKRLVDLEFAVEIRRMAWPTITRSRESVLCDWFLHGRDWLNGAVISVSGRTEDAIERYDKGERPDWADKRDEWDLESRMAETRGEEFTPPHKSYYPISEYSNCWKVPDNVLPEWLAACREVLRAIVDNGAGPEDDKEHESNKANVKEARKCLRHLEERFGKEE